MNDDQQQPPQPQPDLNASEPVSSPQLTNQPPLISPAPKKPKRWPLVLLVVALLVAIGAVAILVLHHSAGTTSSKASLTLYYSDGKTVLWQSGAAQSGEASGFVSLVRSELSDRYGLALSSGSWAITTSLDSTMQQTAEANLATQQATLAASHINNSAIIAASAKTGKITSWASKTSDNKDLLTSKIPVGTLVLPLTFAGIIQKAPSTTAETTYADVQTPFPGYQCTNHTLELGNCLYDYDRNYLGTLTLAQALGGMRLVPTANAALSAGLFSAANTSPAVQFDNSLVDQNDAFACYKVGTPPASMTKADEAPCYAAALFGDSLWGTPQNMLTAYTTLANGGKRLAQTSFTKVVHNAKVVYTWQQPAAKQVVSASAAQIITSVLADPSVSTVQQKAAFIADNSPVSIVHGTVNVGDLESTVAYNDRYVVGAWAYAPNNDDVASFNDGNQLTLPLISGLLQTTR